ncbi:MAG TPA: DUF1579 family protein [Myxococcales bacterium]|nr:DUF1579 family protein [Myxococcales bacterium]
MLLALLAAATVPCSGPELRALDFWEGNWDVKDAQTGEFDGDNVITKVLAGCALREGWTDAAGNRGESLFYFDWSKKKWKQVWVTTAGAFKEKTQVDAPAGAVRFQGEVPGKEGGRALDRTTLTPLRDGRVSQVIERSTDGGKTWTKWEGIYSRKNAQCTSAEHRQLDFWLGDWDATIKARTTDGWAAAKGSNHVTVADNGCTVVEDFHADGPAAPWTGRSVSQFATKERKWRQTWVDEANDYLAFIGGTEGKDFVLYGEPHDGRQMRMVFANITADAFAWRWEASTDGGKSWTPQLLIDYARHKSSP